MKFVTTTTLLSLALFLASTVQVTEAFSTPAPVPTSPLAKEAAEIYNQKYTLKQDGTPRTTLTGITEEQALTSFNVLADIYGEDRALGMVKIQPMSLAFDPSLYAETFSVWAEQFGEEETKEMVLRNPGLLSVKPSMAREGDASTMAFSYIIAATRPIGAVGPFIVVAFILIPLIESVTGIPIKEIRESFFSLN